MKIIGITGGVGAGKSCILEFLKKNYNCEIALADDIAKDMYVKGNPCYEKLINLLGSVVLDDCGNLDKKKMAALIYGNNELLTQVNEIVHPAVKEEILSRFAGAKEENRLDFFFLEAALLIEAGYKPYLDELWFVYVDKEKRYERLKASRGYTDERIAAILSKQLSDEEFKANSDFVIDNSFSPEHSYEQIRERMKTYEQK